MNTLKTRVATLALMLAVATTAIAASTAQLTLTDGANPVVIVLDNGSGDMASSDFGKIIWEGSIGVWTIRIDAARTYPSLGSEASPNMNLNVLATSTGSGSLAVSFSNLGYLQHGTAVATIGGISTAFGSLSYTTYADVNNSINGTTQSLTSQEFKASPFYGNVLGPVVSGSGPYSLLQSISISHGDRGSTSFEAGLIVAGGKGGSSDAILAVPDGGATVVLLGSGLLALVAFGSARKDS